MTALGHEPRKAIEHAIHSIRLPKNTIGIISGIEFVFRFIAWADGLGGRISPDQVMDYWGMSRATAYRWKAAYEAVRPSLPNPTRKRS